MLIANQGPQSQSDGCLARGNCNLQYFQVGASNGTGASNGAGSISSPSVISSFPTRNAQLNESRSRLPFPVFRSETAGFGFACLYCVAPLWGEITTGKPPLGDSCRRTRRPGSICPTK